MPKAEKAPALLGGRTGARVPVGVDPKTLELRTHAEQMVLAKVIERADALFAWIDCRINGEVPSTMADKPMVDLISKLLSMCVPDRRQVESATNDRVGSGGATMVIINGDIQRGTRKARQRAIELKQVRRDAFEAAATPR